MTKKIKTLSIISVCFLLLLTACSNEPSTTMAGPAWVEEKISDMSLDQKIGQMFLVGFESSGQQEATVMNDQAKELIEKYHVGGILLFERNIKNMNQTVELNHQLQSLSLSTSEIPLLLAVDQEGGKVIRIKEGVTVFPGNMPLGATRDPQLAYQAGKQMGNDLRALGFNLNLAPSLDVNNNPKNPIIGVRSFGEDPQLVKQMGISMINGFKDGNILASVKHFPGHGDTSLDSHIDLPQVAHSRDRLSQIELVPFQAAIEKDVDIVMTTHTTFPAIDPTPGLPATLSKKVLTDLLRGEMGYQGVIATDDMEMGAIVKHFGTEKASVLAIQAGADLVLIGHSLEKQKGAIEAVKKAVEDGTITEERINQSVKRILQLKAERLGENSIVKQPLPLVKKGSELTSNPEVAEKIAEQSITLVQDPKGQLPVKLDKQTQLLILTEKRPKGFEEAFQQEGLQAKSIYLDRLQSKDIPELLQKGQEADVILVGMSDVAADSPMIELVNQLSGLKKPIIHIGLDTPYEVSLLPKGSTYLAIYGSTPTSLHAVAKAIHGKIELKGQLPVTVSP
ncbi:beta-N-acetylhexosaminidase [Hazenella coriacea]|uniref:beta-N-acetylhexosaminidase n=1 Tax=Hazenella coriacea TaxID=1179467 RepID=A0A4R3L7R1_9BACL|nr:beta-N-acetylhexosaminidase [Hazenella coriacea]TCS95075.1 beta-N-acetylhexosaminidase [Hazenella coriacea]